MRMVKQIKEKENDADEDWEYRKYKTLGHST